ncbi:MAG: response regulator [Chitinophagaceae bacterium]|nr:response regulator [Chitinophagaceae bacterium]
MSKISILIIDDEVDYCMIMKSYLQAKNYAVTCAYTLKDGLKKLADSAPDRLILDNNLPDGKGWDCVDEITNKYPSLKVYLVSAYRQKSDFISTTPNITVWEKPISLSLLDTVFQTA